jgi:hypothetical protein
MPQKIQTRKCPWQVESMARSRDSLVAGSVGQHFTERVDPIARGVRPMAFLNDFGVWLCAGLGFFAGATIAIFAHFLDSFARNPNIQVPRILWLLGALAFWVYAFAAMILSVDYMQARFGVNTDPYTTSYLVGLIMASPIALWLVLKRRKQWQASRNSSS